MRNFKNKPRFIASLMNNALWPSKALLNAKTEEIYPSHRGLFTRLIFQCCLTQIIPESPWFVFTGSGYYGQGECPGA